jgi:hypothetical protein
MLAKNQEAGCHSARFALTPTDYLPGCLDVQ